MYRIRLYIVPEQEEPPYETINFPIERSKKHVKNINYDDDNWWLAENNSLSKNKSMSNVTVTHRTADYKFHDDYWLAENKNLSKDKSLSNAALAAYHATDYNDDWWLTKNKSMCKNKSISNMTMAYHANDYNDDWWSMKNKKMSKNKSISNATVAYRTHDYNDDWWMSKNKSMSNVTVTHRTNVGKVNIIFGGGGRRHECKDSGSLYVHKRNHFNKTLGKEYDLEQKIELEIKMREGTTRLLAACKHQAQSLEAARSLLTSTERMSAYMAELQKRKRMPKPTSGLSVQTSCTARVSLSDLRMPLIWRDTDHFKNRGDYRRFAVFCLARIGTEIYDTTLLCPVDRSLTDLTFPDTIIFNKIPTDFEFRLEVYSHILQDDLSIASTPRKIKKTIHSSISRTVGKKLAASLKDELNTGKIGPHFELVASAKLMLDDAHDSIHTHDLVTINTENRSHQLPLFGHFCCRLAVQPDCVTQEACSGDLSIHDNKAKKWINLWGQLQAFRLDLWEKQEHWEKGKEPVRSIVVDRHTIVQSVKSSPKDLVITNVLEGKEQVTTVRLKNKDELQRWFTCLSLHSQDHLKWKHTAENVMHIESPENVRHSFTRQLRQGSLYDETPLIETTQSDYNHRPTVQDIFGLTPSTSLSSCASSSSSPTFRERSFSSGGSSKSRLGTGTLRSHWPFNSKD